MNLTMNRPTTLAIGIIAIAAISAIALTTLRAHADTTPVLTQTLENSSNVHVNSAVIGTSIQNVIGISSSTNATVPTGTVDFSSYANTLCSGSSTLQAGVALVNGFATSSATVFGANGISYVVHYNGDSNNSAATSSCIAVTPTSQSVTVSNQLSTTTNVLAGAVVTDTALLSGATANATGTVVYTVYSDDACTALSVGAGNKTVNNAVAPASNAIQFNFTGTYYWRAVYSGDQNNSTATSSCTALTIVATSTPSTGTTTPPVIAPSHHHHDNDGNDDDNGNNATSTDNDSQDDHNGIGQDIHDFIKSHFFNGHDNGHHYGEFKNDNQGKDGGDDNEHDD